VYDMYAWDQAPHSAHSNDPAHPNDPGHPNGSGPKGSSPNGSGSNGSRRPADDHAEAAAATGPMQAVQVALDRRDNGGEASRRARTR
jgi:hypothetical protein